MNSQMIMVPVLVQIVLTLVVYILLSVAKAKAASRGDGINGDGCIRFYRAAVLVGRLAPKRNSLVDQVRRGWLKRVRLSRVRL